MQRILSLLPSATEIVAALGAQSRLVGRSHECDFPSGLEELPVCTAPRLDPSASSREIDRAVKAALAEALAVYDVDEEALRRLAPDVIVTQDQCDVCAVARADVEAAVARWTGSAATLVTLHPADLASALADIRKVGVAIGATAQAKALTGTIEARRADIARQTSSLEPRTVACIEWTDPLMAAGNWVPELVSLAGGQDVFGVAGEHAPWIGWDDLRQADPDVIVFMPCGFGLERCRAEASRVAELQDWRDLRAVKADRVFVTDGNSYFNRPGPRLAESLEILAEILHPDTFAFGHEVARGGDGWAPLTP
ncbi:MAG: cobalamin-binding protein [Rhodospirillaceae bacterium]|nr:cobalamin-binding protein [Rhodospirillaceae bacterium]MDD9927858.1 cobalamin-binding protein [Rhodospirillaceae bacterium]